MPSPYFLQLQQIKLGNIPRAAKKMPSPIATKSEKMKVEDREYKVFTLDFLAQPENKYCAIKIDEHCTRLATVVNHKRRRGKYYKFSEKDCEPSCAYCNIEIENRDSWARANGHLLSVHAIEPLPVVVLVDGGLKAVIVEAAENFK